MKKCEKGFSLVEMMVAIGVIMVLTVSGVVYLNNFNLKQNIISAKNETLTNLRMARNLAVTSQAPAGVDLRYVSVQINSSGVMTVSANGTNQYFSKDVAPSGVGITVTSSSLWFLAGDGKLVKTSAGVMVPAGVGESTGILISSTEGVGDTVWIVVDYSGKMVVK